jgi:hypothetical protein
MLKTTLNEGIINEVFCGRSVRRVLIETLLDEILAVVTYVMPFFWIESDRIVDNCFSCFFVIFLNKRRKNIDYVVCKDTKSPDIYLRISNFLLENLRRDILQIR